MLIEKFYVIKTGRSDTSDNKIDWYVDFKAICKDFEITSIQY